MADHTARRPTGAPPQRARSWVRALLGRNATRVGLAIVGLALLAALAPGLLAPHDPHGQELSRRLLPPIGLSGYAPGYWLGTDQLGRDILSRLVYASRISLLISFVAVLVAAAVGVTVGLLCAYWGGWWDLTVMRVTDIQLAFPTVLLVIAIVAVVGPSVGNLIVVMGISGWPRFARIARGSVLSVKEMEYIAAAQASGAETMRILASHVLPNILSPLIVYATFELSRMILLEATLSFLGLGVQPPTPTWGGMINDGKQYVYQSWAVSVMPGTVILVVILAFNMLGDDLRDALDPQVSQD
ncbi:MAG: ABC transporter permease [Candidatus Lambdaproteobacteria bacterium]|nr:ABC transporter permease [Candidatus Lambdaproteobacteria bacterium]